MSFSATIAQATVDTILGRLAGFFLVAAGDMQAAREAARQMLAAYNAETPDEITLAAEVISLQLHTLAALSNATDPELSQNKILRLRGSAVSLSRESHKAQRKLDQLQKARRAGATAPPVEAQTTQPQPAPVVLETPTIAKTDRDPVQTAREEIRVAKKIGGANWLDAYQKRQAAQRMTENLKKNQLRHANQIAQEQQAALEAQVPLRPASTQTVSTQAA